ncbi:ABC transporter ATP-binding protein [Rhizobiaceae bacterium]|nr:ABC transporter ATP-binding protein [Rhizobiaceae bacterium]
MTALQTGAILEARNIRKAFGAVVAADDISVAIPPAARLALIGSNGAGKTTFVNMVTGYLKPDSGTVLLDGKDVTGLAPRLITRAGMCRSFQIPQLCESMSPLDNVLVASEIAGENAGRKRSFFRSAHTEESISAAHAILQRFGLSQYTDQPVSELPGGVRKLIDIAMALASGPRVLLLDEPTSGVSSQEKFPIMDRVMKALEGERAAVIFVEHDMEIVTRYADRVLAFYSGRVIADDTPDAVMANEEVQLYVTGRRAAGSAKVAP